MYENFNEYWSIKKALFEQLGVTEHAARMIWDDAINSLSFNLLDKLSKK